MDTNEELKAATDALAKEVHDLSGRLSAKEILHRRTRNLTRLALVLVAVIGVVAILAAFALVRVNGVVGCIGEWSAASSVRQKVLNDAAEKVAEKTGERDAAMSVLVHYRGDPNNAATDQAKADYDRTDRAKIAAELQLQVLRDEYPPPQIEAFCTRMKAGVRPPKAPGE